MKIVIVGLGKMGSQIAQKIQKAGNDVLGVVLSQQQVAVSAQDGIQATINRTDALTFFGTERVIIWLMIPAENVDDELLRWLEIAPSGSIIIDGGNSRFEHTKERAQLAAGKNIMYVDVGTSGGIHGFTNGFSMMVGGERQAYEIIEPFIKILALPSSAYHYFGSSGSGHYVKMIHNAIEYGMMQSLAEGYRMLQEGSYAGEIEPAQAGEVWKHGSVISSWLNDLAVQALVENPSLTGIDGYVAESGEARWTLENAAELHIPLPVIQAAFAVRLQSQRGETNFATKLLAAMRHKFGGHALNKS